MSEYLDFDEHVDIATSLELLAEKSLQAWRDPSQWKWVVIAAQSALQACMVCALSGSAGLGALTHGTRRKNKDWLEQSDEPRGPEPYRRIADFSELLRWVQDPSQMGEFGGEALTLEDETADKLERLNDLRCRFAHYDPGSWLIERPLPPQLATAALEVIERLVRHRGIALGLLSRPETAARIARALAAARASLESRTPGDVLGPAGRSVA